MKTVIKKQSFSKQSTGYLLKLKYPIKIVLFTLLFLSIFLALTEHPYCEPSGNADEQLEAILHDQNIAFLTDPNAAFLSYQRALFIPDQNTPFPYDQNVPYASFYPDGFPATGAKGPGETGGEFQIIPGSTDQNEEDGTLPPFFSDLNLLRRYVKRDATGISDGNSWDTAYRTIQEAINKAPAGQGLEI